MRIKEDSRRSSKWWAVSRPWLEYFLLVCRSRVFCSILVMVLVIEMFQYVLDFLLWRWHIHTTSFRRPLLTLDPVSDILLPFLQLPSISSPSPTIQKANSLKLISNHPPFPSRENPNHSNTNPLFLSKAELCRTIHTSSVTHHNSHKPHITQHSSPISNFSVSSFHRIYSTLSYPLLHLHVPSWRTSLHIHITSSDLALHACTFRICCIPSHSYYIPEKCWCIKAPDLASTPLCLPSCGEIAGSIQFRLCCAAQPPFCT